MIQNGTTQEKIVIKKCNKHLKKQSEFLKSNRERLMKMPEAWFMNTKEVWTTSLDNFRIEMWLNEMITDIRTNVEKTLKNGYKTAWINHRSMLSKLWVTFDVQSEYLLDYLKKRDTIQLSDYAWSISRTTKKDVIGVIQDWLTNKLAYSEIAKNINALDNSTFAISRSKLIALQETWQAYWYANYQPMFEAQQQGGIVTKKRLSVHDARVRASHKQNESDWRIPLDKEHSWTLELYAPSKEFRCRCTSQFNIK